MQRNGRYYFDSIYNRRLVRTLFDICFSPEMGFADFLRLIPRIADWRTYYSDEVAVERLAQRYSKDRLCFGFGWEYPRTTSSSIIKL